MAPQTFSFTIQLDHRGGLSVHSWRAHYRNKGRQVPQQWVTEYDVTDSELRYFLADFLGFVLGARDVELAMAQDPLPAPLALVVNHAGGHQEHHHNGHQPSGQDH